MRALATRAVFGVGVLLAASNTGFAEEPTIEIRGNVAIAENVYLTYLDVARCGDTGDPQRRAASVRKCVDDFLARSGYELAKVEARVEDGRIVVAVDEGRLDRIVITGAGPFTTFRLQFELELPGRVFNRPLIDRRLAEIRDAFDIEETTYALHRVADREPGDVVIEDPKVLGERTFLSLQQPFELRINVRKRSWTSGARFGFGFDPPDGLFVRAGTRVKGLIFDEDRFRFDSRIGVRVVDTFRSSGTRLGLSRGRLLLRQSSPPLFAKQLRLFLELDIDMIGRNRADLMVDSFLYAPLLGTAKAELRFGDYLTLWAGGGVEQRFLFDVRELENQMVNPIVDATERDDLRAVVEVGGKILFSRDELRLDRDHSMQLVGRYYFPGSNRPSAIQMVRGSYRRVFSLGWDELWVGLRAAYIGGNVPFYNELSIGEGFLRAGFSGEFYARKLASLNTEYRVSVSRDLFKISIFNDLAGFIELDESREAVRPRFADTIGLGLHFLVFDTFQVNAYSGVAFASNGKVDIGFALQIVKAF